jgi:hypothetical protein
MEFLLSNDTSNEDEFSALDILMASVFYKGAVSNELERDIPESFVIFSNDAGHEIEMINLDDYPEAVLAALEYAIEEEGWRPIAVEFCESEEDEFAPINLIYYEEPSEEDVALIQSMFVEKSNDK